MPAMASALSPHLSKDGSPDFQVQSMGHLLGLLKGFMLYIARGDDNMIWLLAKKYYRFEVWATNLDPYHLFPCSGGSLKYEPLF